MICLSKTRFFQTGYVSWGWWRRQSKWRLCRRETWRWNWFRENTSGLSKEEIADEPNVNEASGGHTKKIGKSNWKRDPVLRLREKGDGYFCRSKKTDKILVRSLGRRCSCKKCGAWGLEKIFKYVWSLPSEPKRTFVTSLFEKDDVARRMVSHAAEFGVDVFWKQKNSYFFKIDNGQWRKVCRNLFLSIRE